MTDKLTEKHCLPCHSQTPPLDDEAINKLNQILKPFWRIITAESNVKKLAGEFTFANFPEAVDFVNKIVPLAEQENHHPDLHLYYNRVMVELYTHLIGGLSENDFILAAKIERLV